MKRVIVAACLLLAGCSVTSIDSVKSKQLDLCAKIVNEQVRQQCIDGVGKP